MLPLTFRVAERKRRVIGGGGSYSTTDGAALEAYWMHRNLFGHAESLRLEAAVSELGAQEVGNLTYNVAATFRRPGVFTPDTDFTLQVAGTREVVEDAYESRSVGAKAVESVGRNPDASGKILVQSILGMALAEAVAFYAIFLAK